MSLFLRHPAGGTGFQVRAGHRGAADDVTPALAAHDPRIVVGAAPFGFEMFSLMTSFTKRLGRSFTLRRTWCAGGERDALENDGCASAARGVCDSSQARFAAVSFAVR